METFGICRVCLVPEDHEKFLPIFENNGDLALKIHKISGIVILDVDEKHPSLICKKCANEIEAAIKLKMRILDADEYFSTITSERENAFIQSLIDASPNMGKTLSSKSFIVKTQKRKSDADKNCGNVEPDVKRANISSATPKKLGIHRMIVNKTTKASSATISSANRKKSLNSVKLKPGSKKPTWGGRKIAYECGICIVTFDALEKLNEHLLSHKA